MEVIHFKKVGFLVIAFFVITNFLLGNIALAKKFEISDKDVERIKTGLDLAKTFVTIALSDDKLKTILNTTFRGGKISTDITYGLLVLSAFNEMELVDLVVSQRYKTEAREYFNQVLDERANLISYWKGIGSDLPRVLAGKVTTPTAALTLNTFDITNKTIAIFVTFQVLKTEKLYDGLWYYFDLRKAGNEPHKVAWEEAKIVMGWAAEESIIEGKIFRRSAANKSTQSQLEAQFIALYDKWGPHITPYGIAKEVKEQLKDELREMVVEGVESGKFVEKKPKLSLVAKLKLGWNDLMSQLEKLAIFLRNSGQKVKAATQEVLERIRSVFSQLRPFEAGLVANPVLEPTQIEEEKELPEIGPLKVEKKNLEEAQEKSNEVDVLEEGEVISQEKEELGGIDEKEQPATEETDREEETKEEIEISEEEVIEEVKETEKIEEEIEPTKEVAGVTDEKSEQSLSQDIEAHQEEIVFCQKNPGQIPAQNKVIFNEINWMGSQNSAQDEWIELKNISGQEIDLTGWQILDKNEQIKIVFSRGELLSANEFYLLERTDDDSVPAIAADFIYTGALNNTDEALYLFDENCNLEDEVLANPSWPGGDPAEKRTLERKSDLNWQTSANSGGTPKAENSSGYQPPPPVRGISEEPRSWPKILISEIRISPIEERFVELYNPNDIEVDLTGWYLQRKTETGSSWNSFISSTKFEGKTIQARSHFLIASSTEADILLALTLTENNSLVFKNPNREIVDKLGWGQAQDFETAPFPQNPAQNESLGRKWSTSTESYQDSNDNSQDFEIQEPTPKARNKKKLKNQVPNASFTFWPENPETGQQINFDAFLSTDPDGQITSFFWDFGDGNSATLNQATTTHIFANSGDYLISLWVVDNQETTSSPATTTISVSAKSEVPSLAVVINEIAWMGTKAKSNDEWIELYNNTANSIDLLNWQLFFYPVGKNEPRVTTFTISNGATTTIEGFGFFLLERTNDEPVSNILADQFFKGAINNNGGIFELRDDQGNLIDRVDCSSGWTAGDKEKGATMERINPALSGSLSTNWASNNQISKNGKDNQGNPINGTPRAENSVSKTKTYLYSKTFNEDLTLTYLGSPYIFSGFFNISAGVTLTIEPGVIIKFDYYNGKPYSSLDISGKLIAKGTTEKPIVFTSYFDDQYGGDTNEDGSSTQPAPGNWRTIDFLPQSQGELKNVIFRYGSNSTSGSGWCDHHNSLPMVNIREAKVDLTGVTIEKARCVGLRIENSEVKIENSNFRDIAQNNNQPVALFLKSGNLTIKNSRFEENWRGFYSWSRKKIILERNHFEKNYWPVEMTITEFQPSGNSMADNNFNGFKIAGAIAEDLTLRKDFPYILSSISVPQGKTLTIEPGVIFKFENQGYLEIKGKLLAQGNSSEKIIFTSIFDDEAGGDTNNDGLATSPGPGNWFSLSFSSMSEDSVLDNVIVRYGGRGGFLTEGGVCILKGAISIEDTSLTIANSLFENNRFAGLELINSNAVITKTLFRNQDVEFGCGLAGSTGLWIKNSNPNLSDSRFERNYYGIYLIGDCPDISTVSFSENSIDIFPESCKD